MVFSSILSALVTIFGLVIPGIIFRRKNIITEEQSSAVNSLIVNLTWPCLVIDAMQMDYSRQIMKDSVYILMICLLIFVLIVGVMFPLAKVTKLNRTRQFLTCFMLLFGNTGFIGIPVIQALYGETAVFYMAVIELINDVLIFSVGIFLIQRSVGAAEWNIAWREFFSPGMIGVIVGLCLFVSRTTLPPVIGSAVSMLGNATTPLTMFMIGFQFGGLSWQDIRSDMQVYLVCALKLLAIPVLALLVVCIFKTDLFFAGNPLLEKIVILSFALPVGSVAAIFSRQYESDAAFAIKCVLLSTVLCMVTVPLFAILLEL